MATPEQQLEEFIRIQRLPGVAAEALRVLFRSTGNEPAAVEDFMRELNNDPEFVATVASMTAPLDGSQVPGELAPLPEAGGDQVLLSIDSKLARIVELLEKQSIRP